MNTRQVNSMARARFCVAVVALAVLAACGGGGDSSQTPGAELGAGTTPPAAPASGTGLASTPLAAPALALMPSGELADSTSVPTPVATFTDTLPHSATAAAELSGGGLYKFGWARILGVAECNTRCMYFERVRQNAAGHLSSDGWAYLPTAKVWTALTSGVQLGTIPYGRETHAGMSGWGDFASIEELTPSLVQGRWHYSRGEVSHALNVSETSVAGTSMTNVVNAGVFPADAKSLNVSVELVSGMLIALTGASYLGDGDDMTVYGSVASFRAAHATMAAPYCLHQPFDLHTGLVFDATTQQAAIVGLEAGGVCSLSVKAGSAQYMEQAVMDASGRKVMLFAPPANVMGSDTGRAGRKLLAVSLTSGGQPAAGWAYLPGYTTATKGLYNQAALMAWLQANTSAPEALALP
jgi:hypothetical protein